MPRGQKAGYEWNSTLAATESPSLLDIAWAAGFIEGEGCFSRIKVYGPVRRDGERAGPYFSQTLRASQTDLEPLERLQRFFGGTIETLFNDRYKTRRIFHWSTHGSRARGIMYTIFSFLSGRRKDQLRFALGGN